MLALAVAFCSIQSWSQSDCGELLDHNQDGVIGVEDLMNLLSFFGQPLEVDGGPCNNLESLTYHGYTYPVVAIGDQCWFAESLKTTSLLNGDSMIMAGSFETGLPAWFAYNNDLEFGQARGLWYTGHAVVSERGLCPVGWRVPTDSDFMELEGLLGMPESVQQQTSWRGTSEAYALKATSSDPIPWNGTNTSGFNGVSTGDNSLILWASDGIGYDNFYRAIESGGGLFRDVHNQADSHSVRCVRNAEDDPCWDPDADGVCAADEVSGCLDPNAWNYNPEATANNFQCTDGPPECGDVSSIDYYGHTYPVVAIGDQCWFAENLRTEHYANGDAIPGELSNGEWSNTTEGAQAVYNTDASNLADYGRLYNWYAVDDGRGLCPTGWHVPTDGEYTELTDFLGGSSIAGTQMKSSPSDNPAWDGTNTSGFSALAGGTRNSNGNFLNEGLNGDFWSSSPFGANAWLRRLNSGNAEVYRYNGEQRAGFSVRCVRDE